jgi:N6-L-threonylcarbamoyladenine synthase
LDFSFSGLKTACLTAIKANCAENARPDDQLIADIAWAFQDAVVDTLVIKCKRALKQTGHQTLLIAGGVSANQELRSRMDRVLGGAGVRVGYPRQEFCTDNAAMIAFAGALRLQAGEQAGLEMDLKARWPITALAARVDR